MWRSGGEVVAKCGECCELNNPKLFIYFQTLDYFTPYKYQMTYQMTYQELSGHTMAFQYFRQNGVSIDWVKLQVYGKICVPEDFPEDLPQLHQVYQGQKIMCCIYC